MFSFVLPFFLFLFLVELTFSLQQQECHPSAGGVHRFPPSLEHLFHGVDLTAFDLYAVDEDVIEEEYTLAGLRGHLFNLTYDRGTIWNDGTTTYSVPDQIQTINSLSSSPETSTPVTCFQLSCYKEKMLTADVQVDSDLMPIVNSGGVMVETTAYKRAQLDLLRNRGVFGEIHSDFLQYSATMEAAEDLQGSSIFSNKLNFKEEYAENPEPYELIIREYGTHYFSSGTFGSRRLERTTIKPSYYFASLPSIGNLTDSLRAHFDGQFDRLQPLYQLNVQVTSFRFGSVLSPWLLTAFLKPITDLLENRHPKKEQLSLAIKVHLMKAALGEWRRSLVVIERDGSLQMINWFLMGVFSPSELVERIDECLAETVPDEAVVGKIGHLVETMVDFVGLMHDRSPKNS